MRLGIGRIEFQRVCDLLFPKMPIEARQACVRTDMHGDRPGEAGVGFHRPFEPLHRFGDVMIGDSDEPVMLETDQIIFVGRHVLGALETCNCQFGLLDAPGDRRGNPRGDIVDDVEDFVKRTLDTVRPHNVPAFGFGQGNVEPHLLAQLAHRARDDIVHTERLADFHRVLRHEHRGGGTRTDEEGLEPAEFEGEVVGQPLSKEKLVLVLRRCRGKRRDRDRIGPHGRRRRVPGGSRLEAMAVDGHADPVYLDRLRYALEIPLAEVLEATGGNTADVIVDRLRDVDSARFGGRL